MNKLYGFLGITIGGWAGWWLGEFHSVTLAVVLSGIGSGVGMWAFRKLGDHFLE